ncbi:acyltransferase family protein [Enterococcus hulanensis]|uniref:acyltransferase family protein n=1 Tax=Enterococcus hulanensis TaxID=2559929 RepID=UPI0010F97048|nr:acyltransferase [Enterococcus hulanensis]
MDLVFLIIVFFIILSIVRNPDYSNQSLSVETTTNLQIIAVVFVILHHLSQILRDYPDSFLSSRLIIAGRLAVGLFFFVSGYGLIKQFKQKGKSYLETFFKKRGMSILIPFLIAMVVYFVYRNLIGELNFHAALYSLVNGNPFVGNGWFTIMIMYLYAVFFISAYLSKENDLFLFLILIVNVIIVILIASLLNYGEWWTNAVFCFPLGVIWGAKEYRITSFLFRNYRASLGVLAVLFSFFLYIDEVFYHPIIRALSVLLFVSLIVLCSYKISFKSPAYQLLKKFSFEIYLYQGLFMQLLRSEIVFIGNRLLYVCAVIISTILLAYLMQFIASMIREMVKTLYSKSKI